MFNLLSHCIGSVGYPPSRDFTAHLHFYNPSRRLDYCSSICLASCAIISDVRRNISLGTEIIHHVIPNVRSSRTSPKRSSVFECAYSSFSKLLYHLGNALFASSPYLWLKTLWFHIYSIWYVLSLQILRASGFYDRFSVFTYNFSKWPKVGELYGWNYINISFTYCMRSLGVSDRGQAFIA